MPRIVIEDLADPRLDPYRELTRRNLTRWSGQFIAEGKLVVRRLIESDFPVVSVLISDRREAEVAEWLPESTPRLVIPQELAQQLVGYNFHVGVLACGQRKPPIELGDALEQLPPDAMQTVVVCPGLTDPENLGSLIRIATAFGVDAMLLGPECGDPFSRRVLRVSMGTALRLPLIESRHLPMDLQLLRQRGFDLAATVLSPDAIELARYRRGPRLALLFGNEFDGLDDSLVAQCNHRLTIPMAPEADSLNVAIAAGIFLHHVTRCGNSISDDRGVPSAGRRPGK